MNDFMVLFRQLMGTSIPFVVFSVVFLTGYVVRKILFNRLSRWSKKTSSPLDDVILSATQGPSLIWLLMLAIYAAVEISNLPEGFVGAMEKFLLVLGILSATIALNNIVGKVVKIYSQKIESALPVTSLTQNVCKIIVFGIGGLIILNSLGISITPILATLGVGGLAVALALQDTLANLFSGFHITDLRISNRSFESKDFGRRQGATTQVYPQRYSKEEQRRRRSKDLLPLGPDDFELRLRPSSLA